MLKNKKIIRFYQAGFFFIFFTVSNVSAKTILIKPGVNSKEINEHIEKMIAGDTLLFQQGVYHLKKTIVIRKKSGITIDSKGKVELILDRKDSVVFYIHDSNNIVIHGLKARHERPIRPGEFCIAGVVFISGSHDILLENLELNGSGTHGVEIISSASVTVKNSYLHHNSVAAIGLYKSVGNILIENTRANDNPKFLDTNISNLDPWVTLKDNKIR